MKAPTLPQGTATHYGNGCRCAHCRKAKREQNRAWAEGPRGQAFRADLSDPRHGTAHGYGNLLCRCQRCRAAWAASCRSRQPVWRHVTGRNLPKAEWERIRPKAQHGTRAKYVRGCRCDDCTRGGRRIPGRLSQTEESRP